MDPVNTETATALPYSVKTSAFEGPLELLLNLVESRKLFINEISLASVTDDFLAYARSLPKNDLTELTSFLSIAATLILVKSRSLLPGFIVTKEEEKDITDLETRLALYAMIRNRHRTFSPLRYNSHSLASGTRIPNHGFCSRPEIKHQSFTAGCAGNPASHPERRSFAASARAQDHQH